MIRQKSEAYLLLLQCAGKRFKYLALGCPHLFDAIKAQCREAVQAIAQEEGSEVTGTVHRIPIGWDD